MKNIQTFCDTYYMDRHNTDSVKWDTLENKFGQTDILPLWVADMDFQIPEAMRQAIQVQNKLGVFGYYAIPESFFEALISWHQRRYGTILNKEWTRFSTGVMTGMYRIIQTYTAPQDTIMILTPVYRQFSLAVENTQRHLIAVPLLEQKAQYTIDFETIEQQFSTQQIKILIHCSPHNPVGRVWTQTELEKLLLLCQKYNVLLICDEIHQDLVQPEFQFISMLKINETSQYSKLIVTTSTSKTFNTAALLNSQVIIPDEKMREQYDAYVTQIDHTPHSSLTFSAVEAGLREGEAWLDEVLMVIKHNYQLIQNIFAKHLPQVNISELQGTYLMWLDLGAYVSEDEMVNILQKKAKLGVNYGSEFSSETPTWIRINLATHPKNIEKAAQAIVQAITD